MYLSTPIHGILILGRGSPPAGGDEPDLVVAAPSVDNAAPGPGDAFKLSASVRNRGGAESAATTLRYYRSIDSKVSTGDTEEGSDSVDGLQASETSVESIILAAPASTGTYYYGACVDSVPGESDTSNNCSDTVAVEVADVGGDDHGDGFGTATAVSIPSTTGGELEEGGDRDFFQFEVATAGTLTVETKGDTDTFGTLFDGDEASLETDDDGGADTNFRIEREVGAGTYYVEVEGYSSSVTGAYELELDVE